MFAMGPSFFQSGAAFATLALSGTYAAATVGTPYSSDLTISGGNGVYSNPRVTVGALPAGLALSIVAGKLRLSGTPTAAATSNFTVAVDSGDGQTATSAQSVVVGAGAAAYNSIVAAAVPAHWWKIDEISGSVAADSVASGNLGMSPFGLSWTFADAGVSVPAPAGYLGLGRGINLSVTGGSGTSGGLSTRPIPDGLFGASSATASWTVVIWVAGSAKTSQYIAARANNGAAVIYQFVTDTVEFFAVGYTGTNPRTGSQISLPAADTTTPHMIVYRYDNGQWSGWKDGVKVFDVARSFGCVYGTSYDRFFIGNDGGGNYATTRTFDCQLYGRALTDTEITDMYASRNAP